jgi:hypothetical protein
MKKQILRASAIILLLTMALSLSGCNATIDRRWYIFGEEETDDYQCLTFYTVLDGVSNYYADTGKILSEDSYVISKGYGNDREVIDSGTYSIDKKKLTMRSDNGTTTTYDYKSKFNLIFNPGYWLTLKNGGETISCVAEQPGWLIIVKMIAGILIVISILKLLYELLFKMYGGYLYEEYGFKMMGLFGGAMLVLSLLYSFFTMMELDKAKEFLDKLILLGSHETAIKIADSITSNYEFNTIFKYGLTIIMLMAPLIILYFLYALIKTKHILHTLLTTFIMIIASLIGGVAGVYGIMFVIFLIVVYFMFTYGIASATGGSSYYKCSSCGCTYSGSYCPHCGGES